MPAFSARESTEPLPGELGDQHVAAVADQLRVQVLEGARVGLDAGDVHAALVGEGVAPDVGLVGVGGRVGELVDEVRGLGQQPQAIRRARTRSRA